MMDVIAQKKAEIAAKIAAMGLAKSGSGPSTSVSTPASIPSTPAQNVNLPAKPNVPGAGATALPDKDEIARRVAEARRLVANATTQAAISSNPYMVSRFAFG
jgi:U4/U6 small nuclear ribonucleoprotein PRP3